MKLPTRTAPSEQIFPEIPTQPALAKWMKAHESSVTPERCLESLILIWDVRV